MLYKCEINFYILSKHQGLIKEMKEQGITNDDMVIWDYIRFCCLDSRMEM